MVSKGLPLIFSIAWVFVIIVALSNLVADLIEIVSNYFSRQAASTEPVTEQPARKTGIPQGWLIFALALASLSIIVAIVGPVLAPYGFNQISLQNRLVAPSSAHLFGTDNLGRDILSRVLYGVRIDVFTGLLCSGIIFFIASAWASMAAHFRKLDTWVGDFLEDIVTLPLQTVGAFPWLVLLLGLMSLLDLNEGFSGGSPSTLYPGWPVISLFICLVLLPRAVGVVQEPYRSAPNGETIFHGVLLAMPVILIFTVAGGILYLSTVSYLGLGVPQPFPELGVILTGAGMQFMMVAPWILVWPAACLILLLLSWVMAGECLLERLGFRTKSVWAKIME